MQKGACTAVGRSGKGPPSPQRPLSRQAKKKKKDHPQNRYRIETVAGAAVPGQEPANVDFQHQLGSYARKLIAFFTWYPRTTPESPMTGRTETWFDDHPEREQIAAVLIDYFLNGLGLEWIEQQLERFSCKVACMHPCQST